MIEPCYVFNSKVFHAGDMIYFPTGNKNTKYNVLAPADGVITIAEDLSNKGIGWSITVETPYSLDGKPVFYDLVHSSGLVPGLSQGMNIHRGDPLAIKDGKFVDPLGWWLIDLGFRNGLEAANASVSSGPGVTGWTGLGYFSYTSLIKDDLAQLNPKQFGFYPTCSGNPIQQNKPYATPTPGGFTYP